jgi:hypothetical protein
VAKSSFYEAIYGIPANILEFLTEVFDLYEVRSNESNHSIPHIHAQYGEYQVSIEIKTGKILVGNS